MSRRGWVLEVGEKKINICFFLFFSSGAASGAFESSRRARTQLSWGPRGRREISLCTEWRVEAGSVLFLYKQSLHAVNSSISRILFTFQRNSRPLVFRRRPDHCQRPFERFWTTKASSPTFFWGISSHTFICQDFFSVAKARTRTTTDQFASFSRRFHTSTPPEKKGGIFSSQPSDHGCCNKPRDESPTAGIFPNAVRHHGGTRDARSEAGTRYRQIRPQRAEKETEPGGVDYRPANGPLRLWGKDPNNTRPRNRSKVSIKRPC